MQNIIQQLLEKFDQNELKSLSGDIICSDPNLTLKKGKYYFLSFNPGGDEIKDDNLTLKTAIENVLGGGKHFYCVPYKGQEKMKPLQNRYKSLCDSILETNPEHIFTTNLIFLPSPNSKSISFQQEAQKCWKAHEVFLNIIQPEVIFCNGNGAVSSFTYIQQFIRNKTEIEEFDAKHGSWKIRTFSGYLFDHPIKIIGIPHMSYYHPQKGAEIIKKLIS
ncbi:MULTISPECIES: uracil-DNA glycosylase family protein [Acinetobacter]|uniref:hypothetical protein n=1 Tax=Acinetobacter TaxID=469 RepID=UPI0009493056|nr:hypothetical protein [Acinetobacter haemolyticus]APR69126.1 hypothetical protein AHTJS_01090 [Acinetobacter haemolyticus]ATZ66092.1 hypothetical protein BSR56_01125 [Acinetobacter haemolyticus]NAR64837.1 hypothetical protein [Acinetobacter haemolyticus]NAR75499.1 hypothetical protein [Acinetobacter haemolyticus]